MNASGFVGISLWIFMKNLLIRHKKRRLSFLTTHEGTQIYLERLHTKIGPHGGLLAWVEAGQPLEPTDGTVADH